MPLRLSFHWNNEDGPQEIVWAFSLRPDEAVYPTGILPSRYLRCDVFLDETDSAAVDRARAICTHVVRVYRSITHVVPKQGGVMLYRTLLAVCRLGALDIASIEPFPDLLAQCLEWTPEEWARVVHGSSGDKVLTLVEHAAVRSTAGPNPFQRVDCALLTALHPGDDHVRHPDLVPALRAGAEIIDTRVCLWGHEFYVKRARKTSIQKIMVSAIAWAQWAYWPLSQGGPLMHAEARGERLELDRTLEDYGLDDETTVTFF